MQLTPCISAIVARDDPDPARMKPEPHLVLAAVDALNAQSSDCVFIGDSATDVIAGRLADIPVIGFASKPGKSAALLAARPTAITERLELITAVLTEHPLT